MEALMPLLDLLFPVRCLFCRSSLLERHGHICAACLSLTLNPNECCVCCGYPLPAGSSACTACRPAGYSFKGVCAVDIYSGQIKKALKKFKYGGKKYLAGVLGELIARQVRSAKWPVFDAVVPIPLHRERLAERGYDQALLLAHVVGDVLALPVRTDLIRLKLTQSQTKLCSQMRWQNVEDAFAVLPERKPGKRILLVDDLLTTGATSHWAAIALKKKACVQEVYVAVAARSL